MKHYMIAISPDTPWSTLDELLEGQPADLAALPAEYVERERVFVDVGMRFVDAMSRDGASSYRDLDVFDDYPAQRKADFHPAVYTHLYRDADAIERALRAPAFERLSRSERRLVFQLAARDLLSLALTADDGATLATMDDGFYWFVSLPDDVDPATLTGEADAQIFDSLDIFDPA